MRPVATGMLVLALTMVVTDSPVEGQAVPPDLILATIEQGCKRIMSTQDENGGYVLDKTRYPGADPRGAPRKFPVGQTALGLLALQHASPHLKGQIAVEVRTSMDKAWQFLLRAPLEQRTYSAGTFISALYQDNPSRHRKLIDAYATMLVVSQLPGGRDAGMWSYELYPPPHTGPAPTTAGDTIGYPPPGDGDHSNTQFAVLGLIYADAAGFQVPRKTWQKLRDHYLASQAPDGGWGYNVGRQKSEVNMTLVSTISLKVCEEMLFAGDHSVCKAVPENPAVTKGLEWIDANLDYGQLETYGLYASERLGILSGWGELAGKSWFDEGARVLVKSGAWPASDVSERRHRQEVGAAFAVLFLSRGLAPVIINKLKRKGTEDWNNDTYDIKHVVEYISTRFQKPKQWRIVALDMDVDTLLQAPVLYVNGHEALTFTPEEKTRLKEYVAGGGTLLGMACCASQEFDRSFRALVAELWPGRELVEIPLTHWIYTDPRPLTEQPPLLGMTLADDQEHLAVIYSPTDICCRWHTGGIRARPVFDFAANLWFYVDKTRPIPPPPQEQPQTEPQPPTPEPALPGQ